MARGEKILRAAEQLFYERSFAAVGVDEIGERAGVTGPAIYRHFSGKDEILSSLFDEATDALFIRIGGPREDPWEEMEHLIRAQTEFALEHVKLAVIWVREVQMLAPDYRRRFRRRELQYIDRVVDVLERCFPERSRDELTGAAWSILYQTNSVGLWPAKSRRIPDLVDLVADLILGGLQALGEKPASRAGRGSARPAARR